MNRKKISRIADGTALAPVGRIVEMKTPQIYHVAPGKSLDKWSVVKEGASKPKAKGLSKNKALEFAVKNLNKKARPVLLLVHKTRYIIERQFLLSA